MPFRDGALGLVRLLCYCLQRCQWKKTIFNFHVSAAREDVVCLLPACPSVPWPQNSVGLLQGKRGTQPKKGSQRREEQNQTEKVRDTDFQSPGS